ncbi:MAG TPA: TspO/MBR family protein [Ferruginibacter sp.]|nr:TspO/MBR family protein [Ferruginibacter sp.]
MKNIIRVIVAVGLPLAVGSIAGLFTASSVKGWFITLNKPSFNPPAWLFAPVWTILYILMGIAFYMIWNKDVDANLKRKAMLFYFAQLVLNFCWSFIFFYAKQPGWAVVDIILLWILIVGTIYWFSKISKPAAWLLGPYILWGSFAAVLNFAIWKLN